MKVIAKIVDLIEDEIDGAQQYAELAIKYKTEHPRLAEKLHELAGVEMAHVKALHTEATRLIEETRQRDGEPPAAMLAIYEYEHQKQIKHAAEIKALLDEYN